jgi:exo-1,4-beta-D-glucosaminidase
MFSFLLTGSVRPLFEEETMKVFIIPAVSAFFLFANTGLVAGSNPVSAAPVSIELAEGWKIQAAAKSPEKGEVISGAAFAASGWYRASVPSTVLAALVSNGLYKNVFFSKNLADVPADQFKGAWWFRREFTLGENVSFENARLIFQGINYSANVFLNGRKIASADKTFGAFRMFDLDVTTGVKKGKNVLAVEVFPPKPGDYTIGFVDWNPTPPDNEMGLFRPVYIKLAGPVSIDYPFVNSRVDVKTLASADLTVSAIVTNRTDKEVKGTLKGAIGTVAFQQDYSLKPHENRDMVFGPEKFPQLSVKAPKLWWPACMGKPELNNLQLTAVDAAGRVSDSQATMFGIRQVEDYINEKGYRGYIVNGRKVLIKGGGWADELLLRENEKNLDIQMRYTLHMNLNTIRLEGIWGSSQRLYDLADKYGILVMVGWSCQWEWTDYLGKPVPNDTFGGPGPDAPEDMRLVQDYFHDQVLWLRHHPSVFVFAVGSDKLPWPEMEKRYRKDVAVLSPGLPLLTSCAGRTSPLSGKSAVKMKGPYDYVTPNYWYVDTGNGGAFGFNTETGPGPQPPVLESLKKMIPADSMWPINGEWNFHCGRREFGTLNHYLLAFDNRYGKAKSAQDFCFRAQAANYEAMRPMFEAFAVNRTVTTGIIQWMHNASWPKFYWQFYDYFLMPTGAFYAARKACQPLSAVYHYGNGGIYLVNQSFDNHAGIQVTVSMYDAASKLVLTKTMKADAAANSSSKIFDVQPPQGISPLYFLFLTLADNAGRPVSDNFYWLSVKPDKLVFNKEKRDAWYYTGCSEWADLSQLNALPAAAVSQQHSFTVSGDNQEVTATLSNTSKEIAFFIELSVCGDRSGRTVVPAFWDDNYISVLPGQSKTVRAVFASADLGGEKPVFKYHGWNVPAEKQGTVPAEGTKK